VGSPSHMKVLLNDSVHHLRVLTSVTDTGGGVALVAPTGTMTIGERRPTLI
jgi:hypothetical protein